jgi:hypothetical protein
MTTEKKRISLDYTPSHKMNGKYAILMETSPDEYESWYYFIRIEGNERNLKLLQEQIENIEWYAMDDCHIFDVELEHPVSAITAKEMTKIDVNHCYWHRKFDGILKPVVFNFKKKDNTEKKMIRVTDLIGNGLIENFIDDEDIDEEDLATDDSLCEHSDNEEDDDSEDDDASSSDDDDVDESSDDEEMEDSTSTKINYKLPPSLL